jgi:hypothetical protein
MDMVSYRAGDFMEVAFTTAAWLLLSGDIKGDIGVIALS